MKQARRGFLDEPYNCQKDWPENCFVQCGDKGVVIKKEGSYGTSFFEAFPRDPDTFIRGEGESVEEAEKKAWEKYQSYSACDGHEFEKRDYRNGAGFCVKCNMFKSKAFEPWEPCKICGKPTFYSIADDDKMVCKKDFFNLSYEDVPESIKYFYSTAEEWEAEKEERKLDDNYYEET